MWATRAAVVGDMSNCCGRQAQVLWGKRNNCWGRAAAVVVRVARTAAAAVGVRQLEDCLTSGDFDPLKIHAHSQ